MITFAMESYAVVTGEAVLEALAMYVRGWVVCPSKGQCEIRSNAAEYRLAVHSDTQFTVEVHPKPDSQAGLKAEMLCLWLGLHRAGMRIKCDDPIVSDFPESAIPSRAKLAKTVMFRRLFMDDYRRYPGTWKMPKKLLRTIHQMFARTPKTSELAALAMERPPVPTAHTVLDYDGYKIEIQSVDGIIRAHRLLDYTPDDAVFTEGLMTEVQTRRSWGEAFIPHMAKLTKVRGLMCMGDQAFLISDRIERYKIEDAGSLRRRHQLMLGPGVSQVYSYQDWIGFADSLIEIGQLPSARKCLAQAVLQSSNPADQQKAASLLESIKKAKPVDIYPSADFSLRPLKEVREYVNNDVWQRILDIEIDRARINYLWLGGNYVAPIQGVRAGIADVQRAVAGGLCTQAVARMTGWIHGSLDAEPMDVLFSCEVDGRLIVFGVFSTLYFVEGCRDCVFDFYADSSDSAVL